MFKGETAAITGGAIGISAAITRKFSPQGLFSYKI
jgi:hypothetical protein